jgi:2-amino-4-hydroxy-6-hydroxymethyldihydropteridine diphosphokinase
MSPGPSTPGREVFIALGSNLGEPQLTVRRAMHRLEGWSTRPLRRSSLWTTAPVDCPPGSPPFINAVVGLIPDPAETPESLLRKLQALEREFGRRPNPLRNAPRPLDLDLLVFGREQRATADLVLPHPRAHERGFVLAPLSEIAPGFILPGQSLTVRALFKRLPVEPGLRRM